MASVAESLESEAGRVQRIVDWLREGFPTGVPPKDFIPLVALLRRRLTDAEVKQVAKSLRHAGIAPAGPVEIGAEITRVTNELPSKEDIRRVQGIVRVAANEIHAAAEARGMAPSSGAPMARKGPRRPSSPSSTSSGTPGVPRHARSASASSARRFGSPTTRRSGSPSASFARNTSGPSSAVTACPPITMPLPDVSFDARSPALTELEPAMRALEAQTEAEAIIAAARR